MFEVLKMLRWDSWWALSHKSKTKQHTSCCEENYLYLSQNQYNLHPFLRSTCVMVRSHTIQYILINTDIMPLEYGFSSKGYPDA